MSQIASASEDESGVNKQMCMARAMLDCRSASVDVNQADMGRGSNNKKIDSSLDAAVMSAPLKREANGTP